MIGKDTGELYFNGCGRVLSRFEVGRTGFSGSMFDRDDSREASDFGRQFGLFVADAPKLRSGRIVRQVHGDKLFVHQVELGLMYKELVFCSPFGFDRLSVSGVRFVKECSIVKVTLSTFREAGSIVSGLFVRLSLEFDVNTPTDVVVVEGVGVF